MKLANKFFRNSALYIGLLATAVFFAVFVLFMFSSFVNAGDPPSITMEATEGQGGSSNEFYVGRCFKVNFRINTNSVNTNGVDVELNYDKNITKIVDSDCTTQATDIYSDALYDTYPAQGNSVSDTKILLSAYNDPGVSTNVANGLYGHFFVKAIAASSTYNFNFEYVQDDTTDTNLAQTGGDGSDILNSADSLTLSIVEDTNNPTVTNQSPANGATGVSVSSNVTYTLGDTHAGIDSSSAAVRMKKGAGAYVAQTESNAGELSTNQNRYYQYSGTVNPDTTNIKTNSTYYEYDTLYTVEVTVDDLGDATTHSTTSVWTFTTEDDDDAPYISDLSPADAATGVATTANVSFHVKDYKDNGGTIPGMEVDTSTISAQLYGSVTATTTYVCADATVTCDATDPNDVIVTINPATDFGENEGLTLKVNASDNHVVANAMAEQTYTFTTTDTVAPTLSNFSPAQYSTGNSASTNVGFTVSDDGAGVAIETLQVWINNTLYVQADDELTVTGDSSAYGITINPPTDFTDDRAVVVRISVRDQSPALNYLATDPTEYTFVVGLDAAAASCPAAAACPACNCGSGSRQYIYVKEECSADTVKETPVQSEEPKIMYKDRVIELTVPYESFPEPVAPSVEKEIEPLCSDEKNTYVDFSYLIEQQYNKKWHGGAVLVNLKDLPSEIELHSINGKSVTKEQDFARIHVNESYLQLAGYTNLPINTTLPIVVYPTDGPADANPIVSYVYVQPEGKWNAMFSNVLEPGEYRIAGFVQAQGANSVEHVSIGSIVIPEGAAPDVLKEKVLIKGASDAHFSSTSAAPIVLLLLMTMVSLTVFLLMRSIASGVGFGFTVMFLIIGLMLIRPSFQQKNLSFDGAEGIDAILQEAKYAYEVDLVERAEAVSVFGGVVVDATTERPLANVVMGVNERQITTGEDGKFLLKDITNADKVKLSAGAGSHPFFLQTGIQEGESHVIRVHSPLLQVLEKIEGPYSQRKFTGVYQFASAGLKGVFNQDQFVDLENTSLFEKLEKNLIVKSAFDPRATLLEQWTSRSLEEKFENVLQVDYVYVMYSEEGGLKKVREPWYFVEEDGEWVFVR